MNKLLITLSLIFICGVVHSSERYVSFGGWSKHLVSNKFGDNAWNEDHRMVGFGYKEYSVNYFVNSYGKDSVGVGYDYEMGHKWNIEYGVYAAVWTGYEDVPVNAWGAIPVITPYVRYMYKNRCGVKALINPVVIAGVIECKF